MSSSAGEETHFGDRQVPLDAKQGLVDDVFHKVAGRYDLMNDLMSVGLHRLWKDMLVAKVAPAAPPPLSPISTSPAAPATSPSASPSGRPADDRVTVADINPDMLRGRRERAARAARGRRLDLRRGQRRGAAVRRRELRRLHDRLRHPQRAAHRRGARRGASRAAARRAVSRAWSSRASTRRGSTGSTTPIPTPSFPRSAGSSPATARLTAISSNRSASFPTPERFADMIARGRAFDASTSSACRAASSRSIPAGSSKLGGLAAIGHAPRLVRAGLVMAREGVFVGSTCTGCRRCRARSLAARQSCRPPRRRAGWHGLSRAMERLGPSYVKLGQFLATRPDIVGAKGRARTGAAAGSGRAAAARASRWPAIEAAFRRQARDAVRRIRRAVAAASIAQVHRARVGDGECAARRRGQGAAARRRAPLRARSRRHVLRRPTRRAPRSRNRGG